VATAQYDIDLKVACKVRDITSTNAHSPCLLVLLAIDKRLMLVGKQDLVREGILQSLSTIAHQKGTLSSRELACPWALPVCG
jgi:hypothetical protein